MSANAEQIDWVKRVLGVDGATTGGNASYDKARAAWLASRRKVAGDVEKLKTAIVGSYADRGLGPKLEAAYKQEVAWVLQQLDDRVSAALDGLTGANGTQHANLLAEAKEAIGDYTNFLSTDKTVQALDSNPFVKLSIKSTLSATLSALSRTLA